MQRAGPSHSLLVVVALGGVGLGFALGTATSPGPRRELPAPAPAEAAVPPPAPLVTATTTALPTTTIAALPAPPPAPAPPPPPPAPEPDVSGQVAALDRELATLAKTLAEPASAETVRAVLDDLAAWDDLAARRDALAAKLPREPKRPASPSPQLRERAGAIERTGLHLGVAGAPSDVEYLPAASLLGERGARRPVAGVALAAAPGGARAAFRFVRGGVERRVVVREDAKSGRDVLTVEYGELDQPPTIRREAAVGAKGSTWRALAERLWTDGLVEHRVLEELVAKPLARPPRAGFVDWLRRHLNLPRNRDLGEEYGPPPPLTRVNPLLLRDSRRRPALLDRQDLTVDAARAEPPVSVNGNGPLVLIAANAVGVYDVVWRWIVFDAPKRRIVDHAELEAGEVEHIAWDFFPEPEKFPAARRGDLTDALCAQAQERVRQAFALLVLPAEVSSLALELRKKIGGLLSADGLEALRLRDEVVGRHKRLDALAHLLLDEDGITWYERALDRAKHETAAEVQEVIVRMIEAGRDGPAEYLMRDERMKALLFHPPVAREDRDKLRRLFRERFRPFGTRVARTFRGDQTHWYDEDE